MTDGDVVDVTNLSLDFVIDILMSSSLTEVEGVDTIFSWLRLHV